MALLVRQKDGRERPLAARTLVGRSSACTIRLDTAHASGEHATVSWTEDGAWSVRDLGSKNGTFVDGHRLDPGRPLEIKRGAKLAFGAPDDAWVFEGADAPGLVAVELSSGDARWTDDTMLALPADEDPAISIYRDRAGRWVSEGADGIVMSLDDEAVVQAGKTAWRVCLPVVPEGTPMADQGPTMDTISLDLAVSQDEERVEIKINHRGQVIPLEPREHGYVLLTLARLRLEDAERPAPERGWVDRDELLRMLRMDANGFNVAVHRARQQLLGAGITGAAGVVEVRRRQRRFGTDRVRISRL